MNKYVKAVICASCGIIKMSWTKLFHMRGFCGPVICFVSPCSEITIEKEAQLHIQNGFRLREGAKVRVRKGGYCTIGKNTSLNCNNMIVCHERIEIGNGCQFGPNVQLYDHDHDYKVEGGVGALKYRTAPVKIGNNVWIGANSVILRGTEIGDNCVIGAGSVLKGRFPTGSVIVQKRITEVKYFREED